MCQRVGGEAEAVPIPLERSISNESSDEGTREYPERRATVSEIRLFRIPLYRIFPEVYAEEREREREKERALDNPRDASTSALKRNDVPLATNELRSRELPSNSSGLVTNLPRPELFSIQVSPVPRGGFSTGEEESGKKNNWNRKWNSTTRVFVARGLTSTLCFKESHEWCRSCIPCAYIFGIRRSSCGKLWSM